MKKSTLTFFLASLVALIAATTFFGIYKIRESQLKADSQLFTIEFSENFLTNWDLNYFLNNCSEEYCSKLPEEAYRLMINNLQRIGDLQEILNVESEISDGFIFGNREVIASFRFDGVYDNETAETILELKQEAGGWKVNNFYINSTLLAD